MIPVQTNVNLTKATFSFFSLRFLLFVLIYFGDILATGFCFLYFSSAAAEAVAALRTVHQLFDCVRILCSH